MRANDLLSPLLALCLFTGCSDGGPDSQTSSTGGGAGDTIEPDVPRTMKITTEEDVRLGHAIIDLPYILAYTTPVDGFQACPSVVTTDDGWVIDGGCMDQDGNAYSGRVTISRQPSGMGARDVFVFEKYRFQGDTKWVEADGVVTSTLTASSCGFPGPNPLDADGLHVIVGGDALETHGGMWPGSGPEVEFEYLSYRYAWNGDCDEAALEARGVVEVVGKGTLGFASSIVDGDCSREADSGETKLDGANEATLFFRGAETCDACVDYAIEGGASGSLCWVQ